MQGKAEDAGGLTPPRTTTQPCDSRTAELSALFSWIAIVREQREIPTNDAIDYAVEYLLTDNPEVDWYDRVLQMSMRVENPCRVRTVLLYYIYAETE